MKRSEKKRCCYQCVYLRSSFFDDTKSYSCRLHGFSIDKNKVNEKSCWRFIRKKEGIPVERQIYNSWVNRIKRNWFYVIIAICTVIGLVITLFERWLG